MEFVEGSMLEKTVKCNYRVMGKKFGKQMKDIATAVSGMSQKQIAHLESEGKIDLPIGDSAHAVIELQDVEIISEDIPGWVVANEGSLTVALDLELTDELRMEGMAREIEIKIQAFRKDSGFAITDHIKVVLQFDPTIKQVIEKYSDYIVGQVLAESISLEKSVDGEILELDTINVHMRIERI